MTDVEDLAVRVKLDVPAAMTRTAARSWTVGRFTVADAAPRMVINQQPGRVRLTLAVLDGSVCLGPTEDAAGPTVGFLAHADTTGSQPLVMTHDREVWACSPDGSPCEVAWYAESVNG